MRVSVYFASSALALMSTNALAAAPAASGAAPAAAAPAAVASAHAAASAAPAASGSAHARADAGPRETVDQRKFRQDYVTSTSQKINTIVNKDKKAVTTDEHTLIHDHWRRAMRALRVRELAEDEHEAATVTRVDTFLKKVDTGFFATLTDLNAKAPVKVVLPPPTIASPAPNTPMPVGGSYTFKIAPYKDANAYLCVLTQDKHFWWNHGNAKSMSQNGECVLDATKPEHARFTAGKAHFIGRALVKGVWTEPVKEDIELTGPGGAAAPAHSGGAAAPAHSGGAAAPVHAGGAQ